MASPTQHSSEVQSTPLHVCSTCHRAREHSSLDTMPSQEPRNVCSQWPPGFLPEGIVIWVQITAQLRSCDPRPMILHPYLPGPRGPELQSLVSKCLSSETCSPSSVPVSLPLWPTHWWSGTWMGSLLCRLGPLFQLEMLTLEVDELSWPQYTPTWAPHQYPVGDISLNRKRSPGSGSLPYNSTVFKC